MGDNDVVIEAWNTVLFQKFLRFKHLLIDGLSSHSDAVMSRGLFPKGARVLDVGCGFGDSTIRIAREVGPTGAAVGTDCAANFISSSEQDARAAGVANASFFCADSQCDDLRGPYDHAFARFGTMFFTMPGAALRNIRRAIRPGGVFTQVVWRKREDNPWLHDAELCVRGIVPVVSHEETDQVHCGPGPFLDVGTGHGQLHAAVRQASIASISNASIPISASGAISRMPWNSRWPWGQRARSFALRVPMVSG